MTKKEFDRDNKINHGKAYHAAVCDGAWSHLTAGQKRLFADKDAYYAAVKAFERNYAARGSCSEPEEKKYITELKKYFKERLHEVFAFAPADGGISVEVSDHTDIQIHRSESKRYKHKSTAYRHDMKAKINLASLKDYYYGKGVLYREVSPGYGIVWYKGRGYDIQSATAVRDGNSVVFTPKDAKEKSVSIYRYRFEHDAGSSVIDRDTFVRKSSLWIGLKTTYVATPKEFWHVEFGDRQSVTLQEVLTAAYTDCISICFMDIRAGYFRQVTKEFDNL